MNTVHAKARRKQINRLIQSVTGLTVFRGVPRGVSVAHDLKTMSVPVETVFDIGANVGQTALECAISWPTAEIFSFEPVSSTFAQLRENTRRRRNVKCHQLAFGNEPGTARIHIHPGSERNSLKTIGTESRPCETVKVETVDRFCEQNAISRISLLKTDTEGFELEVLCGSAQMLSGAVSAVLVEVCCGASTNRYVGLSEIAGVLNPHGFQLSALYDQFVYRDTCELVFANALFVSPSVQVRDTWQ